MPLLREIPATLLLALALAVLPLSGCAKTLPVPVSASHPNSELTDCHAIQSELRELKPLIRDPFTHDGTPLGVMAVIAAIVAVVGGIAWADAKTTDPFFSADSSFGQEERAEIEDDVQFYKGMTYSSLAAFAAFLGLNWALADASERSKKEQLALRKRKDALQRMRAENDCVDYDAQ